jgi:hypothetical protein
MPATIIEQATPVDARRELARANYKTCQACEHFGDHASNGVIRRGCRLLCETAASPLAVADRKPCRTFDHILKGGGCLKSPPMFLPIVTL